MGGGLRLSDTPAEQTCLWADTVAELEEARATGIAMDLANRVFLAAGAGRPYFFDQDCQYTG